MASDNLHSARPGSCHGSRRATGRAGVARVALVALLIVATASPARSQAAAHPPVEDVMASLLQKYKQDDKRFETLAKALEKSVATALDKSPWLKAEQGGADRPFKAHPYFTLVNTLAEAARADGKKRSKNSAETQKLLTTYPWNKDLELVQGLQYGSDRPVPEHENGFINLHSATSFSGYPDLPVNQYLYGLQEIVGWQYRVKPGKKLAYEGRTPKDTPLMATELPSFEEIRVYLEGEVPEVPLLAIPWLTHAIHSRLAERRRSTDGKAAPMDDVLAFLDSKWNGFYFQPPCSKDRIAIVLPVHALYTDTKGFVSQFPQVPHFMSTGDIPFMSVVAMRQYEQLFHSAGSTSGPGSPNTFAADSAYLARYKTLIDEIVRAVLAPTVRYPRYLAAYDFPDGKPPATREVSGRFDVPRKYAVLLWAWADKDPAKVADFLHDKLLSSDANRFPADVPLPVLLTQAVREHEREMLDAIAARIVKDRGTGSAPGDYEREFSPYTTYLDITGSLNSDDLLHSFETFHASAAAVVQDAAYALVQKETGT